MSDEFPRIKNIDSLNDNPRPSAAGPRVQVSSSPAPTSVSLLRKPARSKSRPYLKAALGILIMIIVVLGSLTISRAMDLSNKIFVGQKTSFFQKIKDLISGGSGSTLQGEDLGQVNILLLGIGGEGHDGPYLTDTMILAQIRPDIGEVTLTSIPRDLYVDIGHNQGQQKINSAFALGFQKDHDWNEAGTWARETVQNISGLQIPYFAVVDFSGFEKAVDQVGGVDVTVDRTFTDYQYPKDGTDGYLPPQTFTAGPQHMNGARALIFARSRHAAGSEGSDFARSQRQQKVINAFKSKALSLNLVTNAGTINNLLTTFADHFHTNLTPAEIFRLYDLVKQNNIQQFTPLSLDPDSHIICPVIQPDTGAYTLLPCPGKTMTDVQNFFKNAFTIGKIASEKSVIWLATSTGDTAAFRDAYQKLTDAGLTVWELPYSKGALDQTVVYAANPKPATVELIKNTLGAAEVSLPPPGININSAKVDVIVILGKDASVPNVPDNQ